MNRETVAKAIEELREEGHENPTYNQIHRHVGGGSMSTLARLYRELTSDQPPDPMEQLFVDTGKKAAAMLDIELTKIKQRVLGDALKQAELKVKEARQEREKFIHTRTLLNERADKAEEIVRDLKDRQGLHEGEVTKYREQILALQQEREEQSIEHTALSQKLESQNALIMSIKDEAKGWREKYENEKLARKEENVNSQTTIDRLKDLLASKTAIEKSLVAANEELKKKETVLEKQANSLLEQQSLQDQWKQDMLARIRERTDDVIRGKKQLDKVQAQLEVNSVENKDAIERIDDLMNKLNKANTKLGITLNRLDSEQAAHKETRTWSDKTIDDKNHEIAQLRKTQAELIINSVGNSNP